VDEARDARLKNLLHRLGRLVHAAVEDSDEVNDCLAELHSEGWDAVMFLEASLVCRPTDDSSVNPAAPRVHVETTHREVEYRLGPADARWLDSIGISPTRHRSLPRRALPPLSQPQLPTGDDG
jgi:hypothetical protein